MPHSRTTVAPHGVPIPHGFDQEEAFLRWQAHVEAGRIGGNPPCPADVAANRAASDALFRARARRG